MPLEDGIYKSPTWRDGQSPAISAAELNGMSGAIQSYGDAPVTVTLTTDGWSGSAAPYTYTVEDSTITAESDPFLTCVLSHTDTSADDLIRQNWSVATAYGAQTQTGQIILYASSKPTVNIPMQYRAIRRRVI